LVLITAITANALVIRLHSALLLKRHRVRYGFRSARRMQPFSIEVSHLNRIARSV